MQIPQTKLDWKTTQARIIAHTKSIWIDMPDDVTKIKWGIIESGAGSGEQSLSIYVHLEAYCMLYGADVFYRLLKMAHSTAYNLPEVVYLTREFVQETFNAFEFIGDMGFETLHELGEAYLDSLDSLQTKQDFIALTSAMMTNVVRHHRWVHYLFPWNLGAGFPHRTVADIDKIHDILHQKRQPITNLEGANTLSWQEVAKEIGEETRRIWTEEPEDITRVKWGVVTAGSGNQSFSILVHLEAYLMLVGADIFYRLLRISKNDSFNLARVIDITKEFLERTFNAFEFLGDMGLEKLKSLGEKYLAALNLLSGKSEFDELTSAMMTCVVRHHRWLHYNFPWNLGAAYPHHTHDDIRDIYDILFTPEPPRPPLPPPPPPLPDPPNPPPAFRTTTYRRTLYFE
jgi:hypothetical protein